MLIIGRCGEYEISLSASSADRRRHGCRTAIDCAAVGARSEPISQRLRACEGGRVTAKMQCSPVFCLIARRNYEIIDHSISYVFTNDLAYRSASERTMR